ncbi:hypothetical protein ADL26_19625, partial [Thermoactinomyces vulgaris]
LEFDGEVRLAGRVQGERGVAAPAGDEVVAEEAREPQSALLVGGEGRGRGAPLLVDEMVEAVVRGLGGAVEAHEAARGAQPHARVVHAPVGDGLDRRVRQERAVVA